MKFRKKPVVIEAVKWKKDNWSEIKRFCPTALLTEDTVNIMIPALEGIMQANVHDWIIKGVKGEFYPCRNDIFEATYERVD